MGGYALCISMKLRNGKVIGESPKNININTLRETPKITDFLPRKEGKKHDIHELIVGEPSDALQVQVATIKQLLEEIDNKKKGCTDRRYLLSYLKNLFWYLHRLAERKKVNPSCESVLSAQNFRKVCVQKIADIVSQTQPNDKRNTPEVMLYFHTEVMPLCAKLISIISCP